jgi:hypothetical protein
MNVPPMKFVSHVHLVYGDLLYLVLVMLDIMIMDTLFVNHVILNVILVILIQVVTLVLKEEVAPQNVLVQKANTLTQIGNVNLVTTCVKLVILIHIPVMFVLVTELMLLTVLVL